MGTYRNIIAIIVLLSGVSHGVTTITGTTGGNFKTTDLSTNVTTGSCVLIVADDGNDGFLNLATGGAITTSTSGQTGKTITIAQAGGLTVNTTFGGDKIMNIIQTGNSGSIAALLSSIDVTSYVGKNFAIVYFNSSLATLQGVNGLANQYFGMMRLADWTLPSDADGKTYSLSISDANGATSFFSTSTSITLAQVGSVGFFTGSGTAGTNGVRGTTFQIVPEPSAILLVAFGALGFLRRRRN